VRKILFLIILILIVPLSAASLKRRVLVIPFDNTLKVKNYAWMSLSIAENLKTGLVDSGKFEVLDVTLLQQIEPGVRIQNLTAKDASLLAQRVNCEAVIVGRYIISKEGQKVNALIQTEGVDALSKESVLIKSEYAEVDAAIFETVQTLSTQIANEFGNKLSPIVASDAKRNDRIEKLIRRLQVPPKGYIDTLAIAGMTLSPEFDIDIFEYLASFSDEATAYSEQAKIEYTLWRENKKILVNSTAADCKNFVCPKVATGTTLTLSREKIETPKYTIQVVKSRPKAETRWWVAAGYPYILPRGTITNGPDKAFFGEQIPLGQLRGFANLEAGLSIAKWQPFSTLRWSFLLQNYFMQGSLTQTTGSGLTTSMLSSGGGVRIDYPFWFASGKYGIAPHLDVTAHYQRLFASFTSTATNLFAVAPELGFTQFFALSDKMRLLLTIGGGAFIYSGQQLAYARASFGVEFAVR